MVDQSSFLKPLLIELTYGTSSWKKPAKVVATSNVTQSGAQTIDGVAIAAEDEVLCVGQTSGAQNGAFIVGSGAWTRRTDCDTSEKLFAGCRVPVTYGTHADEVYRLVTTGRINIGVTAQSWELDTPPGAGTGNISNGGNTFGASVVLGSNDAQALIFETNNTERARFLPTGEMRLIAAAPSAARHVSADTNGRLTVFVDGAAQAVPAFGDLYQAITIPKFTADSAGTTIFGELPITGTLPFDVNVTAVFAPAAGLTAHDTNYKIIGVYRKTAGGSRTTVLQSTTTNSGARPTGNWTSGVDVPIYADDDLNTSAFVPAGDNLFFEFAPANSGVIVPAGCLYVSLAKAL